MSNCNHSIFITNVLKSNYDKTNLLLFIYSKFSLFIDNKNNSDHETYKDFITKIKDLKEIYDKYDFNNEIIRKNLKDPTNKILNELLENTTIIDLYEYNNDKDIFKTIQIYFNWMKPLSYNNKMIILDNITYLLNNQEFPINSDNFIFSQTNNVLDIISTHNRLKLDYYVMPNRKEYLDFLQYYIEENDKHFKPYSTIFEKNKQLTYYLFKQQKFVTNYLNENTPYRGLLLYHGLGSGKSGASISTVEGFKEKKVVVMTPKSLEKNYITEIKSFGKISYKTNYKWCFYEFNINNKLIVDTFVAKGVPRELIENYKDKKNTIVVNHKKNKYGIWLIDISGKKSNFNEFEKKQQKQIQKTIDLLIDYKYTFISYNSGPVIYKNIFTKLTDEKELSIIENDILTKDDRLEFKKNKNKTDNIYNFFKQKILNYIFNPTLTDNRIENPFDNKIVVIDEIHNLISMMTKGNTKIAPYLYELLMRAKNVTLVCLSGTPFINTPFELTILFNLLRGNIQSYELVVKNKSSKVLSIKEIESIFNKIIYLDRVEVIQGSQPDLFNVTITKLPKNFIRKYDNDDVNNKWNGKIIKNSQETLFENKQLFFNYLEEKLSTDKLYLHNKINIQNHATFMPDLLLPNDINQNEEFKFLRTNAKQLEKAQEEFFNLYVDKDNKIKEKLSFYVRTMGLISFFCETTEKVSHYFEYQTKKLLIHDVPKFPKVNYNKPYKLPLTVYQLLNYVKKREKEILEDDRNKQQKAQEKYNDDVQKSFRTHTRQISNFGFPPTILRKMAACDLARLQYNKV